MGWKGESRRHSMSRKGIKTTQGQQINGTSKLERSSSMCFESNGVLGEVISLANLVGFGGLLDKNKASGVKKDAYEKDAKKIIVYPSTETAKSIKWLRKEHEEGDRVRRKQVERMITISVKEIESRIAKQKNIDVRINLHKSRKMLVDLRTELI